MSDLIGRRGLFAVASAGEGKPRGEHALQLFDLAAHAGAPG
jgi:hypothetical protein